jgi:hypothetical protein
MKGLIKILLKEQAPKILSGAQPIAGPNDFMDLLKPNSPNIFNGKDSDITNGDNSSGLGSLISLATDNNFVKQGWVFVDESDWNDDIKEKVLAAKKDADDYTVDNIMVAAPTNNEKDQTVVLAGKTTPSGDKPPVPHKYVIQQNNQGEWGWMDDDKKSPTWQPFKTY